MLPVIGLGVLANATMAPGGCSQTSNGVTCAPAASASGQTGQLNISSLTFTQTQANETTALLVLLRKSTTGVACADSLWSNVADGCHVGPFSSTATIEQRWSEIVVPNGQTIAQVVAGMATITSPTVLAPNSPSLDVFVYATEDKTGFVQCSTDADCTGSSARGGHCEGVPGTTDVTGGQRFCNGGTVTLVGGACATGSFNVTSDAAILNVAMTLAAPTPTSLPFNPKCASCPSGQNACSAGCSDLTKDPKNCGACENACLAGSTCVSSKCVDTAASCTALNAGGTATNYQLCGSSCTDTNVDDANCGKCGTACSTSSPVTECAAGKCVACPGAKVPCGGACVDVTADSANCGTCGNACPSGQGCSGGTCSACPTGKIACPAHAGLDIGTYWGTTSASPGGCVTPTSDPTNCGACGVVCVDTTWDNVGVCGSNGVCTAWAQCPDGSYARPLIDPNNCGACGNVCPAGTACVTGACGCAPPMVKCGSACVDTTSDPNNCGACGTSCPTNQSCFDSACEDQTCIFTGN